MIVREQKQTRTARKLKKQTMTYTKQLSKQTTTLLKMQAKHEYTNIKRYKEHNMKLIFKKILRENC